MLKKITHDKLAICFSDYIGNICHIVYLLFAFIVIFSVFLLLVSCKPFQGPDGIGVKHAIVNDSDDVLLNSQAESEMVVHQDPFKAWSQLRACSQDPQSANQHFQSIGYTYADDQGSSKLKRDDGHLSQEEGYLRCVYFVKHQYGRKFCSEIYQCKVPIVQSNCVDKGQAIDQKLKDYKASQDGDLYPSAITNDQNVASEDNSIMLSCEAMFPSSSS